MTKSTRAEITNNKKITTEIEAHTYLIEFGSDEQVCSVSFRGKIPLEEVRKMLASAQNLLYKNIAEGILKYMDQNHLEYWDFAVKTMPLEHETVMKYADTLLHSGICNVIDSQIKEADIYLGIMDHQHRILDNFCEGCYYAVTGTPSEQGTQQYKIIAQTFHYNESNGEELGSFAIRADDGNRNFHTIAAASGESVIPAFGCVDMMGILLKIDNIKTAEQAGKIAAK